MISLDSPTVLSAGFSAVLPVQPLSGTASHQEIDRARDGERLKPVAGWFEFNSDLDTWAAPPS
jgi:hypothetical protein